MKTAQSDTQSTPNAPTVIPLGWFRRDAAPEAVAAGLVPVTYHRAELHLYHGADGDDLPSSGIFVDFTACPEAEPEAARPMAELDTAAAEALETFDRKHETLNIGKHHMREALRKAREAKAT